MVNVRRRIIFSNYDDMQNPYYGGGGAFAIHDLAKRLVGKYNITVLTGSYPGAVDEVKDGVAYKRVGLGIFGPRIRQLLFGAVLMRYALTLEYDLWVESFTPPFSTSCLQLFTRKPVVGLIQILAGEDMLRKYKLPFYLIERLGLKTYRTFIVLTKPFIKKIRLYNRTARIEVIPNGVIIPQQIKPLGQRRHILFLGRIEVNQKGLDLLIAALHNIKDTLPCKLVIAGSGPDEEVAKLKRLVVEHGLESVVDLVGRVQGEQKEKLFRNALFVVIPSRFETGYPLVSVESFAYGKTFVCFDIEGMALFSQKECIKVPAFDSEQFAAGVQTLIEHSDIRTKKEARTSRFLEPYTWEKVVTKYDHLFASLLK